jgi:adenosine deaminase
MKYNFAKKPALKALSLFAASLFLAPGAFAAADSFFDGSRVTAVATDAPSAAAEAPETKSAPAAEKVTKKALRETNDEVMALRQQVWAGKIPPAQFYSGVQAIYARRFGQDYAPKVSAFLDHEAANAPRPEQTVDFSRMTEAERANFFTEMPKGSELHMHLTGAIPADEMMKMGDQLGIDISTANVRILLGKDLAAYGVDPAKATIKIGEMSPELRAAVTEKLVSHDDEDFGAFLQKWLIIGPITNDARSYYPMMRSMAAYAKRQNIVYLEILVSGYPSSQDAAAAAAKRVQAETGVTIRLIASSGWNQKSDMVDAWTAKADELRGQNAGVVGYNMVNNEKISPLNHYESFKKMRDRQSQLLISLHAGEQSGTAGNIVNDLLLGANRYGHCTHVTEDPLAEAVLYENKMGCEVSLISNQKTRVMTDLSGHPVPKLLGWKVPVIPSTDDPGVFKSDLGEEYAKEQSQFGLSWDELKEMSRNGIRYSFADAQTKAVLMKDLNKRLKTFEKSSAFRKYRLDQAVPARRPIEIVQLKPSLNPQ